MSCRCTHPPFPTIAKESTLKDKLKKLGSYALYLAGLGAVGIAGYYGGPQAALIVSDILTSLLG